MQFAVLQFPASNCDQDCVHAVQVLGHSARLHWHKSQSLAGADAVIVPGGFSYGDYLRCGAIARFSPIMQAVAEFAAQGGPVLGICNGFQILCEAGLLPGALVRNRSLQFRCEMVHLKTVRHDTRFTSEVPPGQLIRLPIAHGEGCFYASPEELAQLNVRGQVLWQYCGAGGETTDTFNPNGSVENIAGVMNERGNVAGLMPHPDRAMESILGSTDGRWVLESLVKSLQRN